MLDKVGAQAVEVLIRGDGKVLWINTDEGCVLRICKIAGPIIVNDERGQHADVHVPR